MLFQTKNDQLLFLINIARRPQAAIWFTAFMDKRSVMNLKFDQSNLQNISEMEKYTEGAKRQNPSLGQSDRQTDGQTDRNKEETFRAQASGAFSGSL